MASSSVMSLEPVLADGTRVAAAPPPRKRRRRTAAGGANDDCFTCRKLAVKCDRKRPYCTQCIDIGKECSGYKTTLTWGVGVASRGKLRGLSCPIANKNADGSDISPTEVEARKRKSSVSKAKRTDAAVSKPIGTASIQIPLPGSARLEEPTKAQLSMTQSLPTPSPNGQGSWQIPGFRDHMQSIEHTTSRDSNFSLPPLHHLQTSLGMSYDTGVPQSGRSVGSYAETEFHSPLEYPHTPGSLAFSDGFPSYPPFGDTKMSGSGAEGFASESAPSQSYFEKMLPPQTASTPGDPNFPDGSAMNPSGAELSPLDSMLFGNSDLNFTEFDPFAQSDADGDSKDMVLLDTRFGSPFFHLTPRLQTLLGYYDRNVCPYLVAFDGPENPYRKHILQLAIGNEGLQNAIAALATNNLRMRRKEAQATGFVEEIPDNADAHPAKDYNEVTPEEALYKQMSIDQLNMQLADRGAAQDDSVLATLLILCLFHVCDSGFSKFKTQLAGVQKLLSMRNPTIQSEFTSWVEMFFTWFDVMTSAVNDREMQIKGESLDMLDFSANLGALEQYSGCDGRLFKLIARLGRLNLLAQGRPVKSNGGSPRTPHVSAVKRSPISARSGRLHKPAAKARANKPLSAVDFDHMDGNGWGSPIISSDDDAEYSADDDFAAPDERREFWSEWHDSRSRLHAWQMDLSSLPSQSSQMVSDPSQLDARQRDLLHINESFRFSALLYTERLGHPLLPSSHPQFQCLVKEALHHITALSITSCVNKFLLWPLFITGTECVDEHDRGIIRSRCIEVQRESGFFNNISGLELLERVWREAGSNVSGHEGEEMRARRRDSEVGMADGRYGQAFRWRKAMDRVDGEYIVV